MKWKTLESKSIFKAGFVSFNVEKCELPDGRIMPSYYVLDFPDWVNVFPVTKDGEVILVRQHRQAVKDVHLEIPGGGTARGESPESAAVRELLEETGYQPGEMLKVFEHQPNPALQSNTMHTYLALDCELIASQSLDPYEDIEVVLEPLTQVERLLDEGKISHTIVVASMYRSLRRLKELGRI